MDGGVAGFAQATTPHQTSGIKTSLLSQERISGNIRQEKIHEYARHS